MTVNTFSKASMSKLDDHDPKKHKRKRAKQQMQLNLKSVMTTMMLKRSIMKRAQNKLKNQLTKNSQQSWPSS